MCHKVMQKCVTVHTSAREIENCSDVKDGLAGNNIHKSLLTPETVWPVECPEVIGLPSIFTRT